MKLKKILALALVTMMVLASVSALAETNPVRTNEQTTMTIPVTKTIYFYNDQGADVYEPNIKYTFTITPATVGSATVTESEANGGSSAAVKAGDMRAFGASDATTSVSRDVLFSSNHAIVSGVTSSGKGVTKGNSFTFTGTAITSEENVKTPGIYRYVITETTSGTKASVGIVEPTGYDKTLILDVYVDNTGKVTGAVIHDPDDETGDKEDGNVTSDTKKTTGFGGGEDPTGEETPKDNNDPQGQKTGTTTVVPDDAKTKEDTYTTYNFGVSKKVTGDMGDKSNNFPFTIKVENSISGAVYSYFDADKSASLSYSADGVKKTSAATDSYSDALKDGETIFVKGVPSSTTANLSVTVTETNNTADTYKVNAKLDSDYLKVNNTQTAEGTTVDVAKDATAAAETKGIKTAKANVFEFTNKLDSVSPTGVVLRFAPYLAILAAGVAIFFIALGKRRKSEEE